MILQKDIRQRRKATVARRQITHRHPSVKTTKLKNMTGLSMINQSNTQTNDVDPEKLNSLAFNDETNATRRRHHRPATRFNYVCEHLTTVSHVCIVAFTTYILYLCFTDKFEFFTWHPFLFAIGWMCLMTEAVLMITKDNVLSNRMSHVWRVRWHWIMQVVAVSCSLAGFIIVVLNKEYKNKKHFKSYHGLFGLLSMICALIPTCLSGIPALFNVELRNVISPKLNKLIHAVSGIISVILGGVTMVLSLYTGWFNRKIDKNQDIFIVCYVAVTFGIVWCLVRPFITFFQRLKTF